MKVSPLPPSGASGPAPRSPQLLSPLSPRSPSLAGPSPAPPRALSSPPAWHSLCCGRAQQLPAVAWPLGAPVGQGKLGSWDFPGLWPAGSLPLETEPCSWPQGSYSARPKFRGGAWGLPLISTLQVRGSGLRGPESSPIRVGTGRRYWRAVGGDPHQPKLAPVPQAAEQWGGGSLDVSPLRAG